MNNVTELVRKNNNGLASNGRKKISWHFLISFFILFFFTGLSPGYAETSLLSILEQSTYTHAQKENIVKLFKKAEEKGIPLYFILPRLEEGIAKKVPYKRLSTVLTNEVECLEKARDLLLAVDPGLLLVEESTIWQRTSILFSKRISPGIITAIARASIPRWEDYREATVLYCSLTQWGLTDDEALAVIETVLASSIPGPDFTGIVTLFIRGRSLHISPGEIIIRIKETIDDINSIEILEEKILY